MEGGFRVLRHQGIQAKTCHQFIDFTTGLLTVATALHVHRYPLHTGVTQGVENPLQSRAALNRLYLIALHIALGIADPIARQRLRGGEGGVIQYQRYFDHYRFGRVHAADGDK